MLESNWTVETLNIGDDMETTLPVASKSPSIKQIIIHTYSRQSRILYTKQSNNKASGYAHIKSKYRPLGDNAKRSVLTYAKKIYDTTENHIENQTVEETYPNLKFIYYRNFNILEGYDNDSNDDEHFLNESDFYDNNDSDDYYGGPPPEACRII
ncbi:hypothetical protein PPL_01885 [Heterostelium album PN500]|uniref:Uncharacterized protein n=1 Tax=Heterostelium pallidum (strain ATCC 26659 / Pp 5 / PN500) TaxID=670386 RepID=D3B0R8_HETP5|nr:hypothetical protein PPL_01885 [Heterostelium album PN500]EFA84892.1 hypothetical protein PPL_01885 [Heterostelium album PN500]|eukprot:XP_020437003.1 hypothetical protein PPL_01885 [Heterostelium album PN500]